MQYGDEKRLHMARSILPSTWRGKAAREKQFIKQAARRRVRQALRHYDEGEPFDLRHEPRARIGWVVQDRRGRDKLNHFCRWAAEVTRDLPVGARLSAMRGLLPKGLIGDHALLHLRHHGHFRSEHDWAIGWRYGATAEEQALRRRGLLVAVLGRPQAAQLLEEVLRAAHRPAYWPRAREREPLLLHKLTARGGAEPRLLPVRLSAWQAQGPAAPRLAGVDADALLERVRAARAAPPWQDLEGARVQQVEGFSRCGVRVPLQRLRSPEHHPEWQEALDQFLDWYRYCDGDLRRVRAALLPG